MDKKSLPFEKFIKKPSNEKRTALIYRGGKSSLTNWILPFFPRHHTFVDVFGGGGGITFAKGPSEVDVYNDIGDVSKFFRVLREFGDSLYRQLYFTPYSRADFYDCFRKKDRLLEQAELSGDNVEGPWVQWAVAWFVSLNQSFRHEEDDPSWLVSKGVNSAIGYRNHVDDLPAIADRLKNVIIENRDFEDIIRIYDGESTLLYCDPPYLNTNDTDEYRNCMGVEDHERLLKALLKAKSQVIVSGYPSILYDNYLSGWKRVTKTRAGGIHNSSQTPRQVTEVLWIKGHHEGLWHGEHESAVSQAKVARVYTAQADAASIVAFRRRNHL